jgi:PAS domain S-box-containing protein
MELASSRIVALPRSTLPVAEAVHSSGDLFAGGGETGALMQTMDWSATPLGPVESWPQNLSTCLRIVLTSRQPMFVWWGKQLINLYNDAYRSILGGKHPWALGQPAHIVWHEIWDQVGPRAETALHSNEGTYDESLLLIMERYGYPEETYYTFSYSPVPDDDGDTGGIICANTDDTQRIISERQLVLLGEMAARTADARTWKEACRLSALSLSTNPRDICFALIYAVEDGRAVLAGPTKDIPREAPFAPETISLDDVSVWPVGEALRSHEISIVANLERHSWKLPHGAWDRPPHSAAVVPIAPSGPQGRAGILVVGLNPYRKADDNYCNFLKLLAGQVSASIANAEAYEQERQRAEALAELDRAKTDFFSNVSHEFRTPLTLLLGPLEEMLSQARERLAREDVEHLTIARRNALRLLKLVNTLLDFSRIEAGRMQAIFGPVDLASLTADIASIFRSAMEKAGLRYIVDCEELPGPIYVDREMWEKIVLNLISNAFKFTLAGEVAITLRDAGDSVELRVRDTGAGIPESELPKIFDRFHRATTSQGRSYEGTGIGLALVQELIKLHGGAIQVESKVNQGSTFTVTLPKGRQHLPADRVGVACALPVPAATSGESFSEEARRWVPGTELQDNGTPERELVLLADDNADMREYVTRLLHGSYRIYAVSNGEEAIEAVKLLHPSLVLTDVMMPKLDGFGVLQAIRSDPEMESTPVILLSARAGEESHVEGLNAGADEYLVKPFTARELLARVGAHLRMAKLRRETAEREARAFAEATKTRNMLAAIVEWSEDAIMSKDLDGIITSWNAAAERTFGYTFQEIVGQPVFRIVPPELHQDELRILDTIRNGGGILSYESARVTKSGARLDVSLTISPVRDAAGTIIGAATIMRDITMKKKSEEALRISERVASVGRLAATIAHEINNPLEAVTNLIYLARQEAGKTDVAHYLAAADEELARVSQMTRQTLGFYRAPATPTLMRTGPLLEAVLTIFAPRARNKGIQLQTEILEDPEIVAVPGEVRQLLINLVGNSIDAIHEEGIVRVRISAAKRQRGVYITVADSGTGIPVEIRQKIFDPFFTTKEEVGTGLGLWICKDIVARHGGSIRLKSCATPGRSWTVFSVFLPG